MLEASISNDRNQGSETGDAGADDRYVWFQGGPDPEVDASPCGMVLEISIEHARMSGIESF